MERQIICPDQSIKGNCMTPKLPKGKQKPSRNKSSEGAVTSSIPPKGNIEEQIDELFNTEYLQPEMIIQHTDMIEEGDQILWRYDPEWEKDMKDQILALIDLTVKQARIDELKLALKPKADYYKRKYIEDRIKEIQE